MSGIRQCILLALATSAFADYLNNAYGYQHGVPYSGLVGHPYAPARYAVAAPALTRSFATNYHGAPAFTAFAAPVAKVATYATAPVAKIATYATAPVVGVPTYGGFLNNAYGYRHGLSYSGLMGYRYAPAGYAVAAPAVSRSYATTFHAAPVAKVATFAAPAVARFGTYAAAPVANVATFATAPVAKVATYGTSPVVGVPAYGGFLNNAYGYRHGLSYSGLMGYRYAPAGYAVAAPAVSPAFSTTYHASPAVTAYAAPVAKVATYAAAPVARVASYHTAPALAAYAAPSVTNFASYQTAPAVASYATAPAVARVATYHSAPVVSKVGAYQVSPGVAAVAHGPAYGYGYGYGIGQYGYGHGLASYGLNYGYGLGSSGDYTALLHKKK